MLKHMHDPSDEALRARLIENPCDQYFCGELSFCHGLPFDGRWHARASRRGTACRGHPGKSVDGAYDRRYGPKDLEQVVVDTTVQPKAVAHPIDARLMHRTIITRQAQPCAICALPSAPPVGRHLSPAPRKFFTSDSGGSFDNWVRYTKSSHTPSVESRGATVSA